MLSLSDARRGHPALAAGALTAALALGPGDLTSAECPSSTVVVDGGTPGQPVTITVPNHQDCTTMLVKAWGGGGGIWGGSDFSCGSIDPNYYKNGDGGGGGAVIARIPVSPGEVFKVSVPHAVSSCGAPGRAAWIWPDVATPTEPVAGEHGQDDCYPPLPNGVATDQWKCAIVLAAGGGSAGRYKLPQTGIEQPGHGGAGGGQPGFDSGPAWGGGGGTATAGGSHGGPVFSADGDGTWFGGRSGGSGGWPPVSPMVAGFGGDGWFGGGGGGLHAGPPPVGTGGGGGSNRVTRTRLGQVVEFHVFSGNRTTPGNAGDPDRVSPNPLCKACPPATPLTCDPGVGRSGTEALQEACPNRPEAGRIVIKFGADGHVFPPKPASDFNGDGQTDIVWQHQTTGSVRFWLMSGYARAQEVALSEVPPAGLKLVAVGDFGSCNAGSVNSTPDGNPDLVFRPTSPNGPNQTWFMDGTNVVSGCKVPHVLPDNSPFVRNSAWTVVTAADFGGYVPPDPATYSGQLDGRPDLVWRNVNTRSASLNVMDGVTKWLGTLFDPENNGPDSDLQVVGAAEFSYPPLERAPELPVQPDLVWQATDGQMQVWYMSEYHLGWAHVMNDGPAPLGTNGYFQAPEGTTPAEWRVEGIGDLNGDGQADLLFRHAQGAAPTGKLWVWLMRNRRRIDEGTGLTPSAETDLNWTIVAPR